MQDTFINICKLKFFSRHHNFLMLMFILMVKLQYDKINNTLLGPDPSAPMPMAPPIQRPGLAPATAARQQELLKAAAPAEPPPPRDPPPDFEFIADPPSISALELDIVKLTAQFVARNGRQFLTDLMKKEERNHQFDFLRPQHSLFQYFTRLLEQYTKVLLPPKELVSKLAAEVRSGVLEQARSRAAWHSHQARRKAADEAKIEKERLAYASIDWHDFVVVETVDYPAGEPGDFPPPTTPLEVGARVLAQERGEDITHAQNEDDDTEMQLESESESESDDELADMEDRTQQQQRPDDNRVQDMEEESSSSEDEGVESTRAPGEEAPLPPRPDRVVVRKYDPKHPRPQPAPSNEEWLVSPITGEKIPANKVADHVRIGLLDPRWLEQRDRAAAERTDRDEALAPGAAIEASLKLVCGIDIHCIIYLISMFNYSREFKNLLDRIVYHIKLLPPIVRIVLSIVGRTSYGYLRRG